MCHVYFVISQWAVFWEGMFVLSLNTLQHSYTDISCLHNCHCLQTLTQLFFYLFSLKIDKSLVLLFITIILKYHVVNGVIVIVQTKYKKEIHRDISHQKAKFISLFSCILKNKPRFSCKKSKNEDDLNISYQSFGNFFEKYKS